MGIFSWFWIKMHINMLKDKNYNVRMEAVKSLGLIKDEKVVELVIQALDDDSIYVRMEAASVLGKIGNKRAVEPLIQILDNSSRLVRIEAAKALGMIKDERSIEPLIQALTVNNANRDDVREKAANALGKIGDKTAIEALIQALHDSSVGVRAEAADSLGKIGDKRAVEPLANLLETSNCTSKKYFIPLGGGSPIPYYAVSHPEAVINQMYTEVYDENNIARIKAAEALEDIGGEDAIKALIKALKEERHKDVRQSNKDVISVIEGILKKVGCVIETEELEEKIDDSLPEIISSKGKYVYNDENLEKLKIINRKNWERAQNHIASQK